MMQAVGSESRANEHYEYPNTELSIDVNNLKNTHIDDQNSQLTTNRNQAHPDQPVPQ